MGGPPRLVRVLLIGVATASLTLQAQPVGAWALDYYTSGRQHAQWTNYYCVPAVAEAELDYINSTSADTDSSTQASYYSTGRAHNKGDYGAVKGVDGRGWAYLLWLYSPPLYSYNDYRYATASPGDTALMWSLRDTGKPAGVMVWQGWHAVLAVGFQATADPRNGGSLQGFYLWDPWYNSGFYSATWHYGLGANVYLTLATFNGHDAEGRTIFSKNIEAPTPGVTYWRYYYVLILRSSAGGSSPVDNPPPPWGPGGGAAPEGPDAPTTADIASAVTTGISSQGLTMGNQLGVDLTSISVGRTMHVESASEGIPSYELAEVLSHGRVIAIAQVNVKGTGGYQFSALAKATPGTRLMTTASVSQAATSMGLRADSVAAVWAPSAESASQFYPIWRLAGGGTESYLYPDGSLHQSIGLFRGFQLRSGR
jgi:hypothetical protein